MVKTMTGTEVPFDRDRAIRLCEWLEKFILENPAPEEFGELALTVWGYRASVDEISRLQEQIAKLRAALKVERAMRHQYFLEEDQDLMVDAWNHCGNNIRDECIDEAEQELRAEGLIG